MSKPFLVYFFLLYVNFIYLTINIKKYSNLRALNGFAYLVGLVIFIIIGLRDDTYGIDIPLLYAPVYDHLSNIEDFLYVPPLYASHDSYLFWFLMSFLKSLGFSFKFFLFFQSLLILSILVFAARLLKCNFNYLLISYCSSLLFLMSISNTLRQGLAIPMFIIFLACLISRKYIPSVIFALLTTLMHGSGAIAVGLALVAYLLTQLNLKEKSVFALVLKVALLVGFIGAIYAVATLIGFEKSLESKYDYYVTQGFSFSQKSPFQRTWVILSIFLSVVSILFLALPLSKKWRQLDQNLLTVNLIKIHFLFVTFWLFLSEYPGIFERFGDYVSALQIVIFSLLFSTSLNRKLLTQYIFLFASLILAWQNYFGASAYMTIKF